MYALAKNRQLVFSIRNYIRDMSEVFSISSLVKIRVIRRHSFVFRLFFFLFWKHSYLCNKKKITLWFKDMKFLRLLEKDFFHSKINFICSRHRVISSIYFLMILQRAMITVRDTTQGNPKL